MVAKILLVFALVGIAFYTLECSTGKEPRRVFESASTSTSTHHEIPPFGLGTWLSDREKVAHAVDYALKAGYRHIDAAYAYKNEDKVGKGIASSGVDRKDIWVTSKLWNTHHQPKIVGDAIDESIENLGVDYLDLYLMHWPVAFEPDTDKNRIDKSVAITDTWKAMEELVRANRTRHIGISNFSPADVQTILDVCEICPYAHEFEAHPYLQQQDFVDWHLEHGIKVIAYSPLGNTNPTYDSGLSPILDDHFWKSMAERKGASPAQVILAWGLQRGTVVIPKSVREHHIVDNLKALDIEFTDQELCEIGDHDKKSRMNDPGRDWGVDLFKGLDDPTDLKYAGDL
jgi:alcohol dehydrogenase (NADP+)